MIFHIRAPMPRHGKSNKFYDLNSPRVRKTLCGHPITEYDIQYRWQAFASGDFAPCPCCLVIKKNDWHFYGEMTAVKKWSEGRGNGK